MKTPCLPISRQLDQQTSNRTKIILSAVDPQEINIAKKLLGVQVVGESGAFGSYQPNNKQNIKPKEEKGESKTDEKVAI